MKKILKLLFILMGSIASLQAMDNSTHQANNDDLTIVPYNVAVHGPIIQQIYVEAFSSEIPQALKEPSVSSDDRIEVLMKKDQPLGFVMYEEQLLSLGQTFPDLPTYKDSSAKLNVLRVNYLAIAKKYRATKKKPGHGFGTRVLTHIKEKALSADQDIIALSATASKSFYEKNGYTKTVPKKIRPHYMALALNDDVKEIIEQVKEEREQLNANAMPRDLNII